MRIVCIADTHGFFPEANTLPDGDVFVHAGDVCFRGRDFELPAIDQWFGELPYAHKILVAGNHDRALVTPHYTFKNVHYLLDSAITLSGVNFYGSPWTPEFFPEHWVFNHNSKQARKCYAKVPKDTHVLITHGPPYSILDRNVQGTACGCKELAARIKRLPVLKSHVFGHIHESAGVCVQGNITYVNAALKAKVYTLTKETK